MKIRTKESITFKTVTAPYAVPEGKVVDLDREVGEDLVKRGLAESEPVPYFVREFNQTVMLCNSLKTAERVESEGDLLAFTPYQLYLLRNRRPREIEAVLEAKKVFHGTVVLAGMTITRADLDPDAKPNTNETLNTDTVRESEDTNMLMNEMYPSNYFKQADLPKPTIFVIERVVREEVQSDGGTKKKVVMYFENTEKPFIVNRTNGDEIAAKFGINSDDWEGQSVELFVDPKVSFGGKRVGGIRVRPLDPPKEEVPF